jgi:hypothetical protein
MDWPLRIFMHFEQAGSNPYRNRFGTVPTLASFSFRTFAKCLITVEHTYPWSVSNLDRIGT